MADITVSSPVDDFMDSTTAAEMRTALGLGTAAVAAAGDFDSAGAAAAAQAAAIQRGNHTGEQAISTVTGLQTALDAKAASSHNHAASEITSGNLTAARNSLLTYRAVAGTSDTLVLADGFLGVDFQSGSATTATVPPNSSVDFPIGTVVHGYQSGAGEVTITPGSGVTLLSRGAALTSAGQYARWSIEKIATDTWLASGDLTA
jgi:hypothetical protein